MNKRNKIVALAGLAHAGMLGGAYFIFEKLMGLPPCAMCFWQRYPHGAAIVIAIAALFVPGPVLPVLGLLAALTTGGIGVYHAGVEQKWWAGPSSCTGSGQDLGALSGADLLAVDAAPKLVMCDQISWQWLGLSMPAWNAVVSFGIAIIWIMAIRASRRTV